MPPIGTLTIGTATHPVESTQRDIPAGSVVYGRNAVLSGLHGFRVEGEGNVCIGAEIVCTDKKLNYVIGPKSSGSAVVILSTSTAASQDLTFRFAGVTIRYTRGVLDVERGLRRTFTTVQ